MGGGGGEGASCMVYYGVVYKDACQSAFFF